MKILAAKIFKYAKIFLVTFALAVTPAKAGIPVIDVASLVQAVMTVMENINQTLKQIEQYKTQLEQYENMLKNTLNPESWIWHNSREIMKELVFSVNTLEEYQNRLGSIQRYFNQFQNLQQAKGSPCFSPYGCSPQELQQLEYSRELASESRKRSSEALHKTYMAQQGMIIDDAEMLRQLQQQASTVEGQVQAIQLANQLASHQSQQLLHIRLQLATTHEAMASTLQAEVNREAQEDAASRGMRRVNPRTSPTRRW